MRSKNILHIATFIAAFALSTFIAGFFITPAATRYSFVSYAEKTPTTIKIERFLQRDVYSGSKRTLQIYQLDDVDASTIDAQARIVGEYHDVSSSMNADEFPADFQRAWNEHMNAWGDYADFLNEQKDSAVDSDFNATDFMKADEHFGKEINRTWYRVLRLANRYGADVQRILIFQFID